MPAASSTFAKSRSERAFIKRLRLGAHFEELESRKKAGGIIVSILIGILFVFSYTMVIQPYIETPTEYNGQALLLEIPKDSYIVDNGDGTYSIYLNGEYVELNDITVEPFCSLPIVRKSKS